MFRFIIFLVCTLVTLVVSRSISTPTCGPVCAIYCQYGNVLDSNGCPTCRCKESPCTNDQPPLEDYFCGRSVDHKDCPAGYKCVIAPNDAYAVCCPRQNQTKIKS